MKSTVHKGLYGDIVELVPENDEDRRELMRRTDLADGGIDDREGSTSPDEDFFVDDELDEPSAA